MSVRVRDDRFREAHQLFTARMVYEADVPFTGWDHPALYDNEISYKHAAWRRAHDELKPAKWDAWYPAKPERILEAVRRASEQKASHNLVFAQPHHDAAIEPVRNVARLDSPVRQAVADDLYRWFQDPEDDPFAIRFDRFADTLRDNGLSCHGSWLAYLAFLYDRTKYFPMRPTYFEDLLQFYGNPEFRIAGHITWQRYQYLLDLAAQLRQRLCPIYGEPSTIELQSYMWVIAYHRRKGWTPPDSTHPATPLDFGDLMKHRVDQARARERRGLLGELFVLEAERERLRSAGRFDLAQKVRHVAVEDGGAGFDVLSFSTEGDERRLEVKATASAPDMDRGFYLTRTERQRAVEADNWSVYRVWNVESEAEGSDIGNVVSGEEAVDWELQTATWRCVPSPVQ